MCSEKGREEGKRVVDEEGVPISKGGEGGGGKEGAGDLILSWRGKSFLLFLFYFGCEEGKGEGRRGRLGERGEGGEVVVFEIGVRRKGE